MLPKLLVFPDQPTRGQSRSVQANSDHGGPVSLVWGGVVDGLVKWVI